MLFNCNFCLQCSTGDPQGASLKALMHQRLGSARPACQWHNAMQVTVAVTPDGRADAVKRMPDGQEVFALPATQRLPFSLFLQATQTPWQDEIVYAQSQNNRCNSMNHCLPL